MEARRGVRRGTGCWNPSSEVGVTGRPDGWETGVDGFENEGLEEVELERDGAGDLAPLRSVEGGGCGKLNDKPMSSKLRRKPSGEDNACVTGDRGGDGDNTVSEGEGDREVTGGCGAGRGVNSDESSTVNGTTSFSLKSLISTPEIATERCLIFTSEFWLPPAFVKNCATA
jgi:hypothetical protein